MPSDTYTFTGQAATGWYAYRDVNTGRMLEADPGSTCTIQALEPGLPMPPSAQWIPAGKADAKAAAAAAKASTSETAPASAPGGEL